MARSDFPRLISEPHFVNFGGFESTTSRLQQAGWEIAAEQDFTRYGVRLLLRHQQLQCTAITDTHDFMRLSMMQMDSYGGGRDLGNPRGHLLRFNVVRMAYGIQMAYVEEYPPAFMPIDAQMQFTRKIVQDVEDMGIFATPLVRTEELIVDESEVSAILAKLVEAQKPEQERIRDRKRLRESREGLMLDAQPQMKFHAQILSIAA